MSDNAVFIPSSWQIQGIQDARRKKQQIQYTIGVRYRKMMILFLVHQEWANMIAVIVIAVVAFIVLFAGTFIQLLLEEANARLRKFIKT